MRYQFDKYPKIRFDNKEKNVFTRRLSVATLGMLCLVIILGINLYILQVVRYDNYKTRSNDNRIKVVPLSPPRGLIYDRNHYILADNTPLFTLEIIPEESNNLRNDIKGLRDLLDLDMEDSDIDSIIEHTKYKRKFIPSVIYENLSELQVSKFAVYQYQFPASRIEAKLKRHYPLNDTLTHALGYVARINKDDIEQLTQNNLINNYAATNDIGKQGIEKYYENILHGTSGYKEVEVDSRGRILRTLNVEPPIPGKDITMTIDIRLQLKAQELLKGLRGAILMINPKNGEILAFFSSPSYNPNPFVRGIKSKEYAALLHNPNKPLINRVTQGGYSPASTVKPLMLIMGLNEELISPQTRFFGAPFYQLPGSTHKFRDWRKWGHGWMDIYRAVEISADTFFYDLAYRAGIDKINAYMSKFGMGQKTGIDIYEESIANLPSKSWKKKKYKQDWVPGDTVSIGIGQGYWTTTLIQLVKAHAILTQNGKNVIPHLFKTAHDPTGTLLDMSFDIPNEQVVNVINNNFWQYSRAGMCRVINGNEGTGRRAFTGTSYTACGKSGTAQVVGIKQDAKYNAASLKEEHRDNALFIAFAPDTDPEVLVGVIGENLGGGSSKAAPITRALLDDYFKYKNSPPPTHKDIEKIVNEFKHPESVQKNE
ncbi:MAG: penicillin-binding protein 2 [Succinivibrionaceae bacterium]